MCLKHLTESAKKHFNHVLLFLTLVNRTYQVPVDLEKAYRELELYLQEENSSAYPGMYFLVLCLE